MNNIRLPESDHDNDKITTIRSFTNYFCDVAGYLLGKSYICKVDGEKKQYHYYC